MSDLIERAAVLEDLEKRMADDYVDAARFAEYIRTLPSAEPEPEEFEWCHDCKEYDQEQHCCHRWTKVIRQTVEEMRSQQPERRWIPVTEALPWNDTEVLVTVRDDSGDTPWKYVSVGWQTPDGQYWFVGNEICYGVIAWMPLPEPAVIGDVK